MRIKYALLLSLVLHASAFVAMDIYLDWKMKNGLLALLQKKGGAKGSKYDGAPVKKPIPPRIVQVEIFWTEAEAEAQGTRVQERFLRR